MTRVVVTPGAEVDLDRLVHTHSLPDTTWPRLRRSLEPLRRFPGLGARLEGRWEGFRFVLGPWRWMVIVYHHDEAQDTVWIVAIVDGRSATSPTSGR